MITAKDLRYMDIAESAALLSNHSRVHIGACVVYKGVVVGVGFNQNKSHPTQKEFNKLLPYKIRDSFLHAEINALINAGKKTNGATIYVFRRGRDGELRNCRPCPACYGMIVYSGVKRVVYTADGCFTEEVL